MKEFWREYWLWICVPLVIVACVLLAALLFAGDGTEQFIYKI